MRTTLCKTNDQTDMQLSYPNIISITSDPSGHFDLIFGSQT